MEQTTTNPPQTTWLIIPPAICATKELLDAEKLLLGVVVPLTSVYGFCKASNKYLGGQCGIKERTAERHLQSLVKKGFLKREMKKHSDGKKVKTTRRLYLTSKCLTVWHKDFEAPTTQHCVVPGCQNCVVDTTQIHSGGGEANPPDFDISQTSVEPDNPIKELSTTPVYPWDEIPDYFDKKHDGKRAGLLAKQGRSKEGLYPCTYEEVWELAYNLRLPIDNVVDAHERLMASINEDNKYKVSRVYTTLRLWLKSDLNSGRLTPNDDVQMIFVEKHQTPEKVFKNQLKYERT